MNKKMTYEAPATEQMNIRFEQNIMSNVEKATVVNGADSGWSWDE